MRKLSELTKQRATQLSISFPTQLPLFRAEPNREHLAEWVSAQLTPMTRQIAQKIVDNLGYIPFESFLSQLQKTVNDFHQKSNGASYILLLGESRQDKLEKGCSDQWIIGLALEHCGLREPEAILTHDSLKAWCASHPDITHILILDDASYSGTQKREVLTSLDSDSKLSIYLGIPFITQYAENTLLEQRSNFKELIFLNCNYMPSTWDILNSEERNYAKAAGIGYISPKQTITYFDHRFADFYSCFQQVYNGEDLLSGSHTRPLMNLLGYTYNEQEVDDEIKLIDNVEEYNQIARDVVMPNYYQDFRAYLIPLIVPPYRLGLEEDKQSFRNAILEGKVGNRSPFPCIDQTLIPAPPNTLISQEKHHIPYKPTKIPIEKQMEYDKQLVLKYAEKTASKKDRQSNMHYSSVSGTLFYNEPPASGAMCNSFCVLL